MLYLYNVKELSNDTQALFDLLYTRNFNLDLLRKELESGKYDAECVNHAAIEYICECCGSRAMDEYDGYHRKYGEIIPGYENSHVTEVIALLLNHGLEPNKVFFDTDADGKVVDWYNIMHQLRFVDNGYQAADSLFLLLNRGGNPNLAPNEEPMYQRTLEDIDFETIERQDDYLNDFAYDALIHYWMVLLGFGVKDNCLKITAHKDFQFDVSQLKNHRNYYYGAIRNKAERTGWQLCIFDKHHSWEVARL